MTCEHVFRTYGMQCSRIQLHRTNNTGAIDVKMDKSLIEENSSFKMLGLSSFLSWSEVLISYLLLKLPPRNLEP